MFGKKKNASDAGAKPAKKKKAKKSASTEGQSRFAEGGIKTLLAENIEKIGLAAVAITAAYVAFASFSQPGLEDSKSPDNLMTEISRAEQKIASGDWSQEAGARYRNPRITMRPRQPPMWLPSVRLTIGWNSLWSQSNLDCPKSVATPSCLPLAKLEVTSFFGPIAVPPAQAPGATSGLG